MAKNAVQTPNRSKYMERMKAKHPDKVFADDEELFGQINDDYDNYDASLSDYEAEREAISRMIADDPRAAQFFSDWGKGENPVVALVRRYGSDFIEALQDPKKVDEFAEANKAFAEKVAKEKDYDAQYEANIVETLASIEKVQQEDGLSDDAVNSAIEHLLSIINDGILGKFTPETIRMAHKALNHDADVQTAQHEGEVRGRNARIEEKLRRAKGDGVQALNGSNGVRQQGQAEDIFSLARQAL